MLKSCLFTSFNNKNANIKCGEIVFQHENAFAIHCERCGLQEANFEEFLHHFRSEHLEEFFNQKLTSVATTAAARKGRKRTRSSKKEDEEILCDALGFDEKPIYIPSEVGKVEAVCFDAFRNEHEICIEAGADEELVAQEADEEEEQEAEIHLELTKVEEMSDDPDGSHDYLVEKLDHLESEDIEEDTLNNSKARGTKVYCCEECGKSYTTSRTLKIHIKLKHLKSKDIKCTQCEDAFLDERSLKAHIKKLHTKYECPQCDRSYKSSVSLRVHQLTHKEVKDIICPYENCGKAFVSKRRLNVHLEVHTGVRKYVCEVCGYRSRSKHALEVHSRGHTGEKPFKCPNCDRYFASKSLVNEHQAMHSKDRPHKCDICEATFARPKALYHHKHLHLKEKKFKCKLCGLAYAQAAGLSAHMRQHKMGDGIASGRIISLD